MNRLIKERGMLIISTLFYAVSIHVAHKTYLADQAHAPIYNRGQFDLTDFMFLLVLVLISTMFLPSRLSKPSALFSYFLFFFLYIPGFVIVLGNRYVMDGDRVFLLIAILASFIIISLPSCLSRVSSNDVPLKHDISLIANSTLVVWIILAVGFIYYFGSVMNFATLSTIYTQRELGQAKSLWLGYLQIYFGYFFSVLLVAYGLHAKRLTYLFIGVVGCIMLYLVTAERTVFILPVFIFLVYCGVNAGENFNFRFSMLMFLSALSFLFVTAFYQTNEKVYHLGFYFLNRVVAIPGLFLDHYSHYFSEKGYTYWSHVRGMGSIILPDTNLLKDPLFPQLGKIIARDLHGVNSNSNASFIATDGIAAFGVVGIIVVSSLLSGYLAVLDFVSRGWPMTYVIPAMAPLPFVLSNGSFFTMLLSFGGLAWIVFLLLRRLHIPKMTLKHR